MVTDEMIERAAAAMFSHGDEGMWEALSKNRREFWRGYAREALEAALSAAEPVVWQPRYKQDVIDHLRTVSDNVSDYAMTVFQTKEQAEEYGHGGHQVRALYAAQPAPSAAVKALEWRDEPIPPSGETLASSVVGLYCIPHSGDRFYLRFRDIMTLGDYSTLDKAKSAAQSDYEARIRSALSAQVQDVAGWQSIETAPRDGTRVIGADQLYVIGDIYWQRDENETETGKPGWINGMRDRYEKDYVFNPTHWMHLPPVPAAPAKQEGGE